MNPNHVNEIDDSSKVFTYHAYLLLDTFINMCHMYFFSCLVFTQFLLLRQKCFCSRGKTIIKLLCDESPTDYNAIICDKFDT